MVLHRLVEIDRADAGHVEAGDPHRADEDEAKRVVVVLELPLQILLLHPLAVRKDIEALFLEVVDLVLALADNHGHIELTQPQQPLRNSRAPRLMRGLERILIRRNQSGDRRLDTIMHGNRSRLVDGNEHCLSAIAAHGEVQRYINGHLVEPVGIGNERVLTAEFALQPLFLLFAQIRLIEQLVQFRF